MEVLIIYFDTGVKYKPAVKRREKQNGTWEESRS
jgi:hypothetical protein